MTNLSLPTVLLITSDPALLARGNRIIAAARRAPVQCEPAALATHWADADAVLIGVDRLDEVANVDPHRRDRVFAIAGGNVPDDSWRLCVAIGAADAISLDESEGWLVDRLTLNPVGADAGRVVRVCGAVGGAGASLLTAGLALAANEQPVVVVDTASGGWLDLLLGIDATGVGWSELTGLRGRIAGDALADTIPRRDGIALLTTDRDKASAHIAPEALRSGVLAAAGLGGTVLLDDGRRPELATASDALSDLTLLVTTSDLRGGLAARSVLERRDDDATSGRDRRPWIVVARTPRRGALETRTFGELVDLADDIYWLREARGVVRRVDRGQAGLRPSDRFVADCSRLLDWVADHGRWAA